MKKYYILIGVCLVILFILYKFFEHPEIKIDAPNDVTYYRFDDTKHKYLDDKNIAFLLDRNPYVFNMETDKFIEYDKYKPQLVQNKYYAETENGVVKVFLSNGELYYTINLIEKGYINDNQKSKIYYDFSNKQIYLYLHGWEYGAYVIINLSEKRIIELSFDRIPHLKFSNDDTKMYFESDIAPQEKDLNKRIETCIYDFPNNHVVKIGNNFNEVLKWSPTDKYIYYFGGEDVNGYAGSAIYAYDIEKSTWVTLYKSIRGFYAGDERWLDNDNVIIFPASGKDFTWNILKNMFKNSDYFAVKLDLKSKKATEVKLESAGTEGHFFWGINYKYIYYFVDKLGLYKTKVDFGE